MENLIKSSFKASCRFHCGNQRTYLTTKNLFLTTSRRGFLSEETVLNFPYKFRNTREIVYTSKTTKAESLDTVNQLLDVKEFKLREGFGMAYV
jgi:hypothetical protein